MYSKCDNMEIIYTISDEFKVEFFESLLNRYQTGLETSMRGSDFIFHYVNLLHYKYHKVNFERGRSYIDSPDWIKKATTNHINGDNKRFPYAATVALNHEEIEKKLQRI